PPPHEPWPRRRSGITGRVAAAAQPSTTPAQLLRPVHLHVGLDHLRLAPLHLLDIEADDARALAETARRMLSDSGLQIDVEHATHWALTAQPGSADGARLLEDLAALHARSARMAEGRSIDAYSPAGTAARQWRRLSTEVQMAWFEHPVNQRREAEGRPAINSLWLEGRTDKVANRPFEHLIADDPVLRGLAQRTGVPQQRFAPIQPVQPIQTTPPMPPTLPMPQTLPSARASTIAPDAESLLIAPDLWHEASSEGDPAAWLAGWQQLSGWFEASHGALPRPLQFILTGERSVAELQAGIHDRWALWRRSRLPALLEAGA
ncbi:MAG: hypothetical protein AB7S98_20410, partial [Burkholderiaceae bacterium]